MPEHFEVYDYGQMITRNDFTMQTLESRIFVLIAGPVFTRAILCEVG